MPGGVARADRVGRRADRLASRAPAHGDQVLFRLSVRLGGDRQICLPPVAHTPQLRRHLVHGVLPLHAAVPIAANRLRLDAPDDVVGRRPRGLDVLDRHSADGRRRDRLAGHPRRPRPETRLRGASPTRPPAVVGVGPDDGRVRPGRRALARLRDAARLVGAGGDDLQFHADADPVAGAGRPRGHRRGAARVHDGPPVLPAPVDHGQLRRRPGAGRGGRKEGRQVHRPDRPGRNVRHVLRGDVPLSGAGRRRHALDRPADGGQLPSRALFHAGRGGVRLGRHSRHDVVPVRTVRDAAAARLHLTGAHGPHRRSTGGEGGQRALLVEGAARGLQEGDRLAPRQERPAPRVSRPARPAPPRRRDELRDGADNGAARVRPAVQEPEGGDGDAGDARSAPSAEEAGQRMSRRGSSLTLALLSTTLLATTAMAQRATDRTGRDTMFVGVDTSGSFVQAGDYANAMGFLAYYIYGHLHGLGGLTQVKELFVAAIGGKEAGEPKAFHPTFKPGSKGMYRTINLAPLEYLSRNLTLRVAYTSPKVAEFWRTEVPRQRVRLWTAEAEIMRTWRSQVIDAAPPDQARLWKWVRQTLDFRVRVRPL